MRGPTHSRVLLLVLRRSPLLRLGDRDRAVGQDRMTLLLRAFFMWWPAVAASSQANSSGFLAVPIRVFIVGLCFILLPPCGLCGFAVCALTLQVHFNHLHSICTDNLYGYIIQKNPYVGQGFFPFSQRKKSSLGSQALVFSAGKIEDFAWPTPLWQKHLRGVAHSTSFS